MSEKNTVVRSMHDLGLAAWFGGALMGAVGLNGATAEAHEPTERARLSSLGWKRWAPVNAGAIAVHAIGGLALINANRARLEGQPGATANTVTKTALTGVAVGLTVWSGLLGRTVEEKSHQGAQGATEPSSNADKELASAQQQLKIAQWAIPAVTGALLVMAAQQGEQQRPQSLVREQLARVTG